MLGRPFISNIQVVPGDENLPVVVCLCVGDVSLIETKGDHTAFQPNSLPLFNYKPAVTHITVNISSVDLVTGRGSGDGEDLLSFLVSPHLSSEL